MPDGQTKRKRSTNEVVTLSNYNLIFHWLTFHWRLATSVTGDFLLATGVTGDFPLATGDFPLATGDFPLATGHWPLASLATFQW